MKKQKNKDVCPKCGFLWIEHEFAVPEPYCPENKEDALYNAESGKRFKKAVDEIKKGIWVDPLKRNNIQFVIQNKGFTNIWFDYMDGFKSYYDAVKCLNDEPILNLEFRIVKREIVETVIK